MARVASAVLASLSVSLSLPPSLPPPLSLTQIETLSLHSRASPRQTTRATPALNALLIMTESRASLPENLKLAARQKGCLMVQRSQKGWGSLLAEDECLQDWRVCLDWHDVRFQKSFNNQELARAQRGGGRSI